MKKKRLLTLLKQNTGLNKIKAALFICIIFCIQNICCADENQINEESTLKSLEKHIIDKNAMANVNRDEINKSEFTDDKKQASMNVNDKLGQPISAAPTEVVQPIVSGHDTQKAVLDKVATIDDNLQKDIKESEVKSHIIAPVVINPPSVEKDISDNNTMSIILDKTENNVATKENKDKIMKQNVTDPNHDNVEISLNGIIKDGGIDLSKSVNNDMVNTNGNMTQIMPLDTKDIVIDEKVLKKVDKQITDVDEKYEQEKKKEADEKEKKELMKAVSEEKTVPDNTSAEQQLETKPSVATAERDIKRKDDIKKVLLELRKDNADKKETHNAQKDDQSKKITGIDFEKLFTTFNAKQALNYDYHSAKFNNFGFLENAGEIKLIKQTIIEQKNPELKKEREEKERQATLLQSQKQAVKEALRITIGGEKMRVASLVYFDDNNWRARVGRKVISSQDKTLSNAAVVKVNKTSIAFLLKKTSQQLVERVKKIRKEGGSYSHNYYLIPDGKKTYIAFKLFIGQTIDLDTLKISG